MSRRPTAVCLLGAMALTLSGCGDAPPPAAVAPPPAAPVLETVNLGTLPKLADPVTTRGDVRIEIARPLNWQTAPPPKGYIFRTERRRETLYPGINVSAAPAPDAQDVTKDNVQQFAKTVKAELTQPLIKDVTAIQIGDFVGVYYIDKQQDGNTSLERMVMTTVRRGYRFILELKAKEGTLLDNTMSAKAVAYSMNFNPAPDSNTPASSETPKPEDTAPSPPEGTPPASNAPDSSK